LPRFPVATTSVSLRGPAAFGRPVPPRAPARPRARAQLPQLDARAREHVALQPRELRDAGQPHVHHRVHLAPLDGLALGGALNLHDLAARGGDHVEIDARARVLDVAEIERVERVSLGGGLRADALDVADADRGDRLPQRARPDARQRSRERHEAARDGGRARTAVGLEDVAVDREGPGPELLEVDGGAQRAPDEALDLLRSAARSLASAVAVLPLGVGARVHLVLGREPALVLALEERRHLLVDRSGAQDDRAAGAVQHRALRGAMEAQGHLHGAEAVERAAVGTGHGGCRAF
jgi:hypothetical protein